MNTPDTTPLKSQLLAQRASLVEQIASLRDNAGRVDASADHFAPDQDSSAQISTARELELTFDARENAELSLVDAALRRIQAGSYGKCTDCSMQIPQARLQAAPQAPRCIDCQELVERI